MGAPIFICYRRDDSGPVAGRLRDAIAHTFSQCTVFLDNSSIEPERISDRDVQLAKYFEQSYAELTRSRKKPARLKPSS